MTRDEFMALIALLAGDNTTDEALEAIEQLSNFFDSINDPNANADLVDEYEQKLKDLDENWRKKYRDAFFAPKANEIEEKDEEKEENIKIDDLFTEV